MISLFTVKILLAQYIEPHVISPKHFSRVIFSIHDIQYSDRTGETIKALGELNNLLITWMEFKNQRAARGQPFWNISEEQRFINHMHTIANRLIRFQADFER